MHRSLVANDLLKQMVGENMIDIAILSEQYCDYCDVKWYSDELHTAAIWLPSQKAGPVAITRRDSGFIWVKVGEMS